METICFCNWKGGVSKTTSSWAFSVGLANKGFKVLMIDVDPQSNLSFTARVDLFNLKNTLYKVFKHEISINDTIQPVRENLDIIPGGYDLCSADIEFTALGREYLLKDALKELRNEYDYCVVDVSPHLGCMTTNALMVTDKVIVPMLADAYSLLGFNNLIEFIENVKKYNPSLKIDGLLLTRTDERTQLTKTMLAEFEKAAENLQSRVYKAHIRSTVLVGETALLQTDLYTHAPNSTAAADYLAFIDEFLKG